MRTKFKISIKEIVPDVFVIIVPNDVHRALLFLRVQEYYESPNPMFRRKMFDVMDFLDWYSKSKYASTKTINAYIKDYEGFNVPYSVAVECYRKLKDYPELMTTYDRYFMKILKYIQRRKSRGKAYIIGTSSLRTKTTIHELYHALYYMDKNYKSIVKKVLHRIPRKMLNELKGILKDIGYDDTVMYDELMAYLSGY